MKQFKLIALALVVLVATSAFAADVDFSGQAAVDFGANMSSAGGEDTTSFGLGQDTGAEFKVNAKEGNLTAEWAFRANAGGDPGVESGWFQYDFGMAQLKYDAKGLDKRWNADVVFVNDSANQTLTVTAANMIFVSVIDKGDAGFEDVDADGQPAYSAGVDATFGPAAVKAGAVLDMFGADGADYTAWMAFVNTEISLGAIGVDLAGDYGTGYSAIWMDKEDAEFGTVAVDDEGNETDITFGEDTTHMGVRAGVKYTMGNMEFGYYGGYAALGDVQFVNDEGELEMDDVTGIEIADVYFQYNIDSNFYIKPMFTYDVISSDSIEDDITDMNIKVRMGYSY